MKHRIAAAAALLAAAAGAASAGTLTSSHSVPFSYNPFEGTTFVDLQRFDDAGGTLELLGVTLSYDQTISFGMWAEQNSPVAIDEGVFFAFGDYLSLHQLGTVSGDGEDIPFLGPGAHGTTISPALGPTDGLNGSGPDYFETITSSGLFNFSASYTPDTDPLFVDAFRGGGTLTTVLGGFMELFGGFETDPGMPEVDPNNPPQMPDDFPPFLDPYYGVFVGFFDALHEGDITVTFEYRVIPSGGVLATFVLGGLMATRRRR